MGRTLAYTLDTSGYETYDIRLRGLEGADMSAKSGGGEFGEEGEEKELVVGREEEEEEVVVVEEVVEVVVVEEEVEVEVRGDEEVEVMVEEEVLVETAGGLAWLDGTTLFCAPPAPRTCICMHACNQLDAPRLLSATSSRSHQLWVLPPLTSPF